MDSYEATKVVFSRIQALDPENASKITGYVLIQEHGEKEMIRLAFGPESLLHALIHKAKTQLGISSNTSSSPSTPSSPFSSISIPSPRLNTTSLPSPLSVTIPPSPPPPSSSASMWQHFSPNSVPSTASSPSYAAVVNGAGNSSSSTSSGSGNSNGSSSFASAPPPLPQSHLNISDDYDFQDHLSFLNESPSSSSKNLDLLDAVGSDNHVTFPYGDSHSQNHHLHRRSLSLSDACCGNFEDCGSGFGWKPCLYFARGFCKNGTSCKFVHSSFGDTIDSPISVSKIVGVDQCEDILRSRIMAPQQQRLTAAAASQFMTGVSSFPSYNRGMNFLTSDKRTASAAAALMMGDEFQKLGLYWPQRRDIYAMGIGGNVNPGSRQIYLTFPADSTFREEDVSNYFSIYGPVQDVRIPFQQKRMFGFVTFVYPETVKLILAKGNPHFVCDSRVLVKPYKEKGKVPDKKQLQPQQVERGEFSTCCSPAGFDPRDPYDLHLGARMFYNNQEMLRRKIEEQADLQQAIELRSRRLMNLQFMDLKNHHYHPPPQQFSQNSVTLGVPIPSSTQPQSHGSQTLILPSADKISQEVAAEEDNGPAAASTSPTSPKELIAASDLSDGNGSGNSEQENSNSDGCDIIQESNLEHILPDSLFASPEKPASDRHAASSTALVEPDDQTAESTTASDANPLMSTTSTLTMAAAKNACSFHMPRFSSDHGAIEM